MSQTKGELFGLDILRYLMKSTENPPAGGVERVLIKNSDQINPILPSLATAIALDNIWMAS